MRGVSGLELEILRVKASGGVYPAHGDPTVLATYDELEARELLLLVPYGVGPCVCGCGRVLDRFRSSITPLGRIVLAASLHPQTSETT